MQPEIDCLTEMFMTGIAEAEDGCRVELDGRCQHGYSSWLLILGWI